MKMGRKERDIRGRWSQKKKKKSRRPINRSRFKEGLKKGNGSIQHPGKCYCQQDTQAIQNLVKKSMVDERRYTGQIVESKMRVRKCPPMSSIWSFEG